MCEAILEALRVKGVQKMKDIVVVDSNTKRLEYLSKKTGVKTNQCAEEASRDAEITILSVKPQNVPTVAAQINRPFNGLLLSICAGVTISDLSKKFTTSQVIRSMPNTPAMVLEGITVWSATKQTPQELKEKAKVLMQSFGEEMEVYDEHYIDMATAVSGSGPAVSNTESTNYTIYHFFLLCSMFSLLWRR